MYATSCFICQDEIISADLVLFKEQIRRDSGNPVIDSEAEESEGREERGLNCVYCRWMVTTEKEAIEVNGRHNHTFFNPMGIVFELRCFAKAEGCGVRGFPTHEFTWFAGYDWSFAHCTRCIAHLGWLYRSADHSFFGLIGNKLTPR